MAWECHTALGTRPQCTRSWPHTGMHQSTWGWGRWWGCSCLLPLGWRRGYSIGCPHPALQTGRNTHSQIQTPLETVSSMDTIKLDVKGYSIFFHTWSRLIMLVTVFCTKISYLILHYHFTLPIMQLLFYTAKSEFLTLNFCLVQISKDSLIKIYLLEAQLHKISSLAFWVYA